MRPVMRKTLWGAVLLLSIYGDALAQGRELAGEWQSHSVDDDADVVSTLVLSARGEARVEIDGVFSQAFLSGTGDEDVASVAELFPEGLAVRIVAQGTWTATTDSLTLRFPTVDLLINGDTFAAFIRAIATALAADVVEQLNLAQEQKPAVIDTFVDLLSADLSEEDVTDPLFADNGEPTAYRLEEDELILTDSEGLESRWQRRTQSVVEVSTWAHIKLLRGGGTAPGLTP